MDLDDIIIKSMADCSDDLKKLKHPFGTPKFNVYKKHAGILKKKLLKC